LNFCVSHDKNDPVELLLFGASVVVVVAVVGTFSR
jgi:hypothetical protein